MVKIELISKEPRLSFVVRGINYTFANALRRMAEEVPILAIDEIEITKNDSALNDEVLAHRLGLIPLEMEKDFTPIADCTCKGKGCAKCTASLTLKAEGPCTVYSKDLKGKVKVVYPDMPIVILEKGNELELIAEARLGLGKVHAKYSPGLVSYRAVPVFTTKQAEMDAIKICIDSCPKKVLGMDEKSSQIKIKELLACDMCHACVEASKKQGKDIINVKPSEEDFIFTIESWGQLDNKEIFTEISKTLDKELKALDKDLSKSK